jgi:hypothetical protein
MTALSAVGAALSAGAGGVCAPAPALNVKTPASANAASSDPVLRVIVIPLFLTTSDYVGGYFAKCEACHIRWQGSALSHGAVKDPSRHRGWTDDNAAEDILVVQVRRLGAISREISELAALRALVTFGWVSAAKSAPKAKACIGWMACEMTFGVFQQVLQ